MEIDNKGLTGCDGISGSNRGNLHSEVDSESQGKSTTPIWNDTELSKITLTMAGSKTNQNTINNSTGNVIETVY